MTRTNMSQDKFTIEVNGVELEAKPGQMLIEVTDAAGIYIPRFCYHKKLSVAANCRMCLVEVEKAPKPLPACATPVMDGMKVSTKSANALEAQKSVMEFLLINHPLDCPICDQGGECELQDLAMGYGRDISRYAERKRVVRDKDIGPLISTDMTRCIHCTRCIRFGEEIAGLQELGAMGRGDRMKIGTFIEQSVDHELSGNVIDLCPVGALNSKPYRFSARAWEMIQHATIAPHDCFGSNLYAHVLNGRVKRMVPRSNEAVNETWISDRDRFSYEGIYAEDRLQSPMLKTNGQWQECSWPDALEKAASGMKALVDAHGGNALGALVSPSATTEEAYLAARVMRHLGSGNIDHRLRQQDFRGQQQDGLFPWLGMSIEEVSGLDAALLVGSNLRHEVPMMAHRIRKAALDGAAISLLNPEQFEYLFPIHESLVAEQLADELASLVKAAGAGAGFSEGVSSLLAGTPEPGESHQRLVASLSDAGNSAIFLGLISVRHADYATIRMLAAELAKLTNANLGYISEGANSGGASIAGALPHRGPSGEQLSSSGANAAEMAGGSCRGMLLLGVEPGSDCAGNMLQAVEAAELVVALTPFFSEQIKAHADVVLPVGTFAETSGTFVNAEGRWQSFSGVASPVGDSRPGWKVLRVLGNLLDMPDCDYQSSESVRDELKTALGPVEPGNSLDTAVKLADTLGERTTSSPADCALCIPVYQVDALVRRAKSLQMTRDARGHGEPEMRRSA